VRHDLEKIPIHQAIAMKLRMIIFSFLSIGAIALGIDSSTPTIPALSEIRATSAAGRFYPANPSVLKAAIQQFIQNAAPSIMARPLGLLVPHAGYTYAGQIYADAYRQALGHSYDVLVILGTNHTTGDFQGVSVGDYSAFHTPLGEIPVDEQIVQELLTGSKDCSKSLPVHAAEHSIEVQLPFIQTLFPNARIVPVIIHPADYDRCIRFGQVLAQVLKNRRALIIMSSDLSHYPNQQDALKADQLTLETMAGLDLKQIESVARNLSVPNLKTRACGEAAILTGIAALKAMGVKQVRIVSYANSGEIPDGDREWTVGYGAMAFTKENISNSPSIFARPKIPAPDTPLEIAEKKQLLAFARKTIACYLTTQIAPIARGFPPRLNSPQGAFVTLKRRGELRGCIGRMQAIEPLSSTVGAMALEAAFRDSRFSPLQQSELKEIEIEISVLSPMKSIANPEAIAAGRDGVLMTKGKTSAVFLPQVAAENNWDRIELLNKLCQKAELQIGCWKEQARFQVFQADVFSERDFR
jgi:AmmeMemoRadiSam system protein B/AmmeMemoRadiSam system protein A